MKKVEKVEGNVDFSDNKKFEFIYYNGYKNLDSGDDSRIRYSLEWLNIDFVKKIFKIFKQKHNGTREIMKIIKEKGMPFELETLGITYENKKIKFNDFTTIKDQTKVIDIISEYFTVKFINTNVNDPDEGYYFLYKSKSKTYNDGLGYGYGSKYQLLRMLGWHRHEFNNSLAKVLDVDKEIDWFDFGFNGTEDKELLNVDFLSKNEKTNIFEKWKEIWACSANSGLNWDAVGIDKNKTYILVEAKANIPEMENKCGAKDASLAKIKKTIKKFQEKYNITIPIENWTERNYQLANRLIFLDFLRENGYKAKFVYVFFVNGFIGNRKNPIYEEQQEEWEEALNKELIEMGIKGTKLEKEVNVLYFDCDREEK